MMRSFFSGVYVLRTAVTFHFITSAFYFALKNLVLPRMAGSSMGLACPALRESEFFGSAKRIAARVRSELKFKVS